MRHTIYFTLLLWSCNFYEQSNPEGKIIGIWLVSDFSINGYDKTDDINADHQQWLELKANGTFRSGSFKIENGGTWKMVDDNVIEISGKGKDWCNSVWRFQVNSNNLVLKGQRKLGTSTVSILMDKTNKLPIYKQYINKPVDRLVGLWEAQADDYTLDTGFWIRMKPRGKFVVGDSTGVLFDGDFLYTHRDSSLVFQKANKELANWKVSFQDNYNMILQKPVEESTLRLKRFADFALE